MTSPTPSRNEKKEELEELIDIITSNNMVEDFVEWLRSVKGIDTSDPISLKDIDYSLLLEYVQSKGLVRGDEDILELLSQDTTSPEPEELDAYRRPTKPKKIRQKR